MADVSLPPVGELVQITTTDGEHVVGAMHNGLFFAAVGQGCWSPCFIASWCRVLVLPDTEETRQLMTATVMAAVRGAAVPRS